MSEPAERPERASISFISPASREEEDPYSGGGGFGGEEPANLLAEGEPELEVAPGKAAKPKKSGGMSSRTLFLIGIGFLVFVLIVGVLAVVVRQRRQAVDQEEIMALEKAAPPIIVVDDPRRPGPSGMQAPPVAGPDAQTPGQAAPSPAAGQNPAAPSQPQMQSPADGQGGQSAVPMQPISQPPQAATMATPPRVQEAQGNAPVAQQGAQVAIVPATVQPQGQVGQSGDAKALDGKIEALGQRLSKVESAITALMPVVERLVQAEKAKTAAVAAVAAAPKSTPEKEKAAAVESKEKTERAESKAITVKPVAVAKAATPATAPKTKAAAKSASKEDAQPAPQMDLRGYGITSLVGTRAWVVKTSGDGGEVEVSVSPGEVLEGTGHKVVSVDGKSKRVCLDNGQCIERIERR